MYCRYKKKGDFLVRNIRLVKCEFLSIIVWDILLVVSILLEKMVSLRIQNFQNFNFKECKVTEEELNKWQILDNLLFAWRLSEDCLKTALRLPEDCTTTARRMQEDCLTSALRCRSNIYPTISELGLQFFCFTIYRLSLSRSTQYFVS